MTHYEPSAGYLAEGPPLAPEVTASLPILAFGDRPLLNRLGARAA